MFGAGSPSRRDFLRKSMRAGTAGLLAGSAALPESAEASPAPPEEPVVIASANGMRSIEHAYERIRQGEEPLAATIGGVNLVEEDPEDITVGYGGIPNAEGTVQLEASVMNGPTHSGGAVGVLEGVRYPSKVARLVMERTDHVRLVGEGAQEFARMHGFEIEDLLTDRARRYWVKWRETLSEEDDYVPPPNGYDEDLGSLPPEPERSRRYGTIHCSAVDTNGDVAGVTSTSGLFYKIPGRVADSSVHGAGLYVDNEVGAAGSTGRGEANLQNLTTFLVVERMRMGDGPEEACLTACRRVAENTLVDRLLDAQGRPTFNVRFYALTRDGEVGGAEIWGGSGEMAVADGDGARTVDLAYLYEESDRE